MALEYLFSAPLFFFSRHLKRLRAVLAIQFSLEEWGGGPCKAYFFSRAVVCVHCVCGGQRIQRFAVVMNPDRPVLPSVVDSVGLGVLRGGSNTEGWQSRAGPCGSRRASTSLDRSVLAQRAEEMGRELVDMWTAAASRVDMCLDTRGDVF